MTKLFSDMEVQNNEKLVSLSSNAKNVDLTVKQIEEQSKKNSIKEKKQLAFEESTST
jgi:hypothetical protein